MINFFKYDDIRSYDHIPINSLVYGDCLDVMELIPDESIDMILADLPFGTTNCSWDEIIPLNDYIRIETKPKKFMNMTYEQFIVYMYKTGDVKFIENIWNEQYKRGLWYHYERIIKKNGVILLFAQTPFDKVLGYSNLNLLRYEWIWEKTQATGHLNAQKMPMKAHENVLVFYKKKSIYNPQFTYGHVRKVSSAKNRADCIIR